MTGAPVADATVRVLEASRQCVTAGDGACRLVVSTGDSRVRATAIGFAPDSQTVRASPGKTTAVAFSLQPSGVPLDAVVTVGTRTPERTVSESPVPVDVVSRELMDDTGMPETWQQLQRLVPSVHVPHIPIGDNHMRPVTLRGMAPHHALVLVNGRRRHPAATLLAGPSVASTAFTDLSPIPSGAVERIEVLRDGAGAQYGSDAVSGVVNVVLREGARRDVRLFAGSTSTSEGGRDFTDGRWISASGTYGIAAANGGHLTMSAELLDRDGTNRAYPDTRPQYFTGDPRNDDPPRISSHVGNGAVTALTSFVSAGTPLGEEMEAYAFGGAARRKGSTPDAAFRRPSDGRTVRSLHPDGFLPVVESEVDDLSAQVGLRGSSRGWRWDVSSVLGGNRVDYSVHNSNNASLGAASPAKFDAGRVATQQWTSNADVTRELRIGGTSIAVAGGAEYRIDRYQVREGEPDSWRDGKVPILDGPLAGQPADVGAQGMFGYRPDDEVSARRNSSAFYMEAESRPFSRLLVQGALRFEHYSDFGSTTDGKLAARVDVLRGLAVRGSFGTGFRAPALSQQYQSSARTAFLAVDRVLTPVVVRTLPVSAPEAQLLGAVPLRPEEARNLGAGLVFELPRFPLVTVDFYRIDLDGRIGLVGTGVDTAIVRFFDENGMRGIGSAGFFFNSFDMRTRGVDVVASHSFLFGRTGVLRILGGYNHTRNEVLQVHPRPPELLRFREAGFTRNSYGAIEEGQPRQTIVLTLHHGVGPWEFNLHNQRSGPMAQRDANRPEADQVVRPRWITDAGVSYRLRERVQLSLSGTNLFDVYPDEWVDFHRGAAVPAPTLFGTSRYPGALSAYGMNGRTVYVQLTYR